MIQLTIKREKFLYWYFDYGQDTENNEIKVELTEKIIKQMYEAGFGCWSVQEIFDNCNKDAIRLYFTCQFESMTDTHDIELSDLKEDYKIKLIN